MISRIRGTLLSREGDRVEVATPGGVVYEVEVPLSVVERLPATGEEVELRTLYLVREDSNALYGFLEAGERELFARLIGAKGVGAKLALAMLSAYPAPRLARALKEKDVAALVQVSGVGRKTAERIFLELSDRMDDLEWAKAAPGAGDGAVAPAQEAVQALMALGMTFQEADGAVRAVLEDGVAASGPELIRKALARR
jgi:holliday junction DNA helicase RuvA